MPLRYTAASTAKLQGHTGGLQPRVESHLGLLGFPFLQLIPLLFCKVALGEQVRTITTTKINK